MPLLLELGCVIRVGTARILVTSISLPVVSGYNVITGANRPETILSRE